MACNFKPYEGNEKYIFVSYAHADGDTVYPILERLNEAGYRIWYDEGIEWGTEFNEYIATHIDNCDVVIAFHSNASNKSDYCKREINYAINNVKKSILSVYIEEVKFSSGMIMQLSPYQATYWFQYDDKEKFFDRLISNTSVIVSCRADEQATETVDSRRNLAFDYDAKGNTYKSEGNFTEARKFYEKSLEIFKRIAKETETVIDWCNLSERYTKIGDTYKSEGNLSEAKKWYRKDLEIREQLVKESKTSDSHWNLSVSYERLGNICESEDNLSEAMVFYKKSMEMREQLAKETESFESYRVLSVSYNKIGDIYKIERNFSEAEKFYRKAIEIREQFQSGTPGSGRELAASYNSMGDICKFEGNLTEAKIWYEKALEICEQLFEDTKDIDDYDGIAVSYYNLATVGSSFDVSLLKKAEYIWSFLASQCPNVDRYSDNLRIVCAAISKAKS